MTDDGEVFSVELLLKAKAAMGSVPLRPLISFEVSQEWLDALSVSSPPPADTYTRRSVTIFAPPLMTNDRRKRVGKYGPKWGSK